MPSSALAILQAFHRQLQQSVQSSIRHFHGQSNPAIANYANEFQKSLPKSANKSSLSSLVDQIKTAETVLVGDFHTLPESQSAFFKILKSTFDSGKSLAVALEIFSASDQSHIDEYLSGRLPEEYFLKRIDYHNKWGFPWENYRPIVDFCAAHKIPIFGINHETNSKDRLSKRDVFAAEIIKKIQALHPNASVLCLIGEYHLADSHLPEKLGDKSLIRILNNPDEFSYESQELPIRSFEVLEMGSRYFCILNTTPWLKWQSLAIWEEMHGNSEESFYGVDSDVYLEDDFDLEYQLLFILRSMNEFLSLDIPNAEFSFDVYIKPDRSTLSYLRGKLSMSRQALESAERKLNQDGFCYIPKAKAILLLDYSFHHLLEAAGHIILECMSKRPQKLQGFQERLRYQIAGSLCALIMNPRRLTFSLDRIESEWRALERKRLLGDSKRKREALKLVRSIHENHYLAIHKASKSLETKDRESHFQISRILGDVIASQLFEIMIMQNPQEIKKGLKALFENELNFQLAQLENPPTPTKAAS